MPLEPPSSSRAGGSAGFTLVELLVATAVLMVVLLFACQLLVESLRIYAYSADRARNPLSSLTAERLRTDLMASRGVGGFPGLWDHGPLPLVRADGSPVTWLRDDQGRLLRQWQSGGRTYSRPYLIAVSSWRWQLLAPGLVEVEVVYAGGSAPYLQRLTAPLTQHRAGPSERLDLVVAPRGAGGSHW